MSGYEPPRYDPQRHQQRMYGTPPQSAPDRSWAHGPQPQAPAYPQQPVPPYGYGRQEGAPEQPPAPHRRKRSRGPLLAGVAVLAVVVAGATAYALTTGSPAKPLSCKQQYANWKSGPARALAEQTLPADDAALQSASGSDDIPGTDAALKKLGTDAAALQAYPMPSCADPAGYWPQFLADVKAAGDNAGSTPGLAGMMTAMAPMEKAKAVDVKLKAELARTAGVKS